MSELFSYDVLPYPSKFFLQTHPDRLAVLGTLFGMKPAPVDGCRVLELGCGNGSNLISHAYTLPDSEFVGIDLGAEHIVEAARSAEELGLKNVEFRQMDVMDLTKADFGTFDYITAHGLFSWVPDFVRTRVLEIFSELLNPNGIGYISYSAYPGAHQRQMSQRILRYRVRHQNDPLEKVQEAISFLAFLTEHASERDNYAAFLQSELNRHFSHDAADIFHDDLSEINQSFYFHEFAELLNAHNLQFLAEAELHAMGVQNLSAEAREFIGQIDDVIEREQYLDFIRGRVFRQTLFCHADVKINRTPDSSILDRFLLSSSISPADGNIDLTSGNRTRFVGFNGAGIEIDHPLTKAALVVLGDIWGRAVKFTELIQLASERLKTAGFSGPLDDEQIAITRSVLFQICLGTNLVELHLFQPTAITEVSEKPRTNILAAWQLPQANNVLTNLNLDVRVEDDVSRELLRLCDGETSRGELEVKLHDFVKNHDFLDDRESILADLSTWIDDSLNKLARLGMFDR